jgi:hypothetical protein
MPLVGRHSADALMRPNMDLILTPTRQDGPGVRQRGEQRPVEALVAQPAVEALTLRLSKDRRSRSTTACRAR